MLADTNRSKKIRLLIDTDANNETDDQHAIAYALFSDDAFDVEGITVNQTHKGGNVDVQMEEAVRVVKLCDRHPDVPMYKGANENLNEILPHLSEPDFDGHETTDFIIRQAKNAAGSKLIVLPIGKLTNIALALAKDPSIIPNVRVVWLGSNFPATEDVEYNLTSDPDAVRFLLDCPVDFEIVTVLFDNPKGTWGLKVSQEEILSTMPGLGPQISEPVVGRHGGEFVCFGDYSANLYSNAPQYGNPPGRPLFDVGAVAVVKNQEWATATVMPRPMLVNGGWELRPKNPMKMIFWDHFDRDAILSDFFMTMKKSQSAVRDLDPVLR